MSGGASDDVYVVDSGGDRVIETAAGGDWDRVYSSISYTLPEHVEMLYLTGTADISGTGNESSNRLVGNDGNNILSGGAGRDFLIGGKGADILFGGTGNDSYEIDSLNDRIVEGEGPDIDVVNSHISYALGDNLENLFLQGSGNLAGYGNQRDNVIRGNEGANYLAGNGGNDWLQEWYANDGIDTLVGGKGNDRYDISGKDVVIEAANEGIDTLHVHDVSASYTLGANIENLIVWGKGDGIGNGLNNYIEGENSFGQNLYGLGGNDTLNGESSDIHATLIGGTGNDTYLVTDNSDVVVEATSAGIDTVQSSSSYALTSNVENLVLTIGGLSGSGNALNNRLSGLNGRVVLDGGAGHDTLQGSLENDFLLGGTGNDVYVVNVGSDVIAEGEGAGIDSVLSSISLTLGAHIEHLTLTGTTALAGTGNALANRLNGNSVGNVLAGGLGNDILDGKAGRDTLNGGAGQDTFVVRNEGSTSFDRITDFLSGTDKLRVLWNSTAKVGDGDKVVEGGVQTASPGGFAASAELVIVTADIAGTIDRSSAAEAIGSATSAYAAGRGAVFVVDNGSQSSVYLFTAQDSNALVSAHELTLLATLQGTASTALGDYVWGGAV